MASAIRVLIADDHPVVLRGLAAILLDSSDIEVVGQASNGVELVALSRELHPDVVIADIKMPEMTGIAAVEAIRREFRETHAIVISLYRSSYQLQAAIAAGASAFLTKEAEIEELPMVVRDVHAGNLRLPKGVILGELMKGPMPTPAELQVLVLLSEGLTSKEVAARIGCAASTVETHKLKLMRKLGFHKETQLVRWAAENGFLDFP